MLISVFELLAVLTGYLPVGCSCDSVLIHLYINAHERNRTSAHAAVKNIYRMNLISEQM